MQKAEIKLKNRAPFTAISGAACYSDVVRDLVKSWSWRGIEYIKINGKMFKVGAKK